MNKEIVNALKEIENKKGVKVLYACEAGSRAWNFASQDSDWDVRFIYKMATRRYLLLHNTRDVIEEMDGDLDLSGWDLKKALKLFYKSNPPLMEWLMSPIVYMEQGNLAQRLREMVPLHNPVACYYHYLHMAKGNYKDYLQGERVWLKKYFYVVRPVLAMKHIEQGHGFPPLDFEDLLNAILDPDMDVYHEISNLLDDKRRGKDLDYGDRISVINEFIEREFETASTQPFRMAYNKVDIDALNDLFIGTLYEEYANAV